MKRFILLATATIFAISCGENSTSSIKDVKIKDSKETKVEVNLESFSGTLDAKKKSILYFLTYKQSLPLLSRSFEPAELKKLFELKHLKTFKEGDTRLKVSISSWETENFKTIKLKDLETTLFAGRPLDMSSKKKETDFIYSVTVNANLIIDPAQLNEGAPKLDDDDDIGFMDIKEEDITAMLDDSDDSKKSKPKGIAIQLKTAFEAHSKDNTIDVYGTGIVPSGFGLDSELNFFTEDESKDFIKKFKYKKDRRRMGDIRNPTSYTKEETIKDVNFTATIQLEEKR